MTFVESTHANDRKMEVGIFQTVATADAAVTKLLASDFTKEQITVICSDQDKEKYFREFEHQEPAGTFAPAAVIAGGGIGILLAGLPMIGVAVATGSAIAWVVGAETAWAGAVAGGLVGAMMTRGVEKELANYYQQAVLDGMILVAVAAADRQPTAALDTAATIFSELGAKPISLREG